MKYLSNRRFVKFSTNKKKLILASMGSLVLLTRFGDIPGHEVSFFLDRLILWALKSSLTLVVSFTSHKKVPSVGLLWSEMPMGEMYLFSDSCLPSMLDAKMVMAVSCNFPTRDKRFATFYNDFNQVYEEKFIQGCYFLMSSVSDSPITAIFQKHPVYTVEKSMVAVVFRFLVSPNSFLSLNVFFHVSHFYQCSTHLYHKPVDFPGFGDIPSDISQLPFSSGRIQFFFLPRFNIRYNCSTSSFQGCGSSCQYHKKAEQCGCFKFFSNRNNQAMGGV